MTRIRILPLLLALFFVLSAASSQAQSRIDCSALNSRILTRVVHYCVYLPSGYDAAGSEHRYPVLYFLHGLGDNERTLFNSGGWTLLDDLRNQHKMGDFLIVAPEGWRSFYINSADGSFRYSDFFLEEFVPHIEHKYRIKAGRSARAISGISMGGYGALRFAFRYPAMFSAVSAQSPALASERPEQLDAAEGLGVLAVLGSVFGKPINLEHWTENNPFDLAKRNAAQLGKMAIYFNCGQDDNYGFQKGASALDRELKSEALRHEYHLYPGDHSFTYFLSHFSEVMEFHSRAFGLLGATH